MLAHEVVPLVDACLGRTGINVEVDERQNAALLVRKDVVESLLAAHEDVRPIFVDPVSYA